VVTGKNATSDSIKPMCCSSRLNSWALQVSYALDFVFNAMNIAFFTFLSGPLGTVPELLFERSWLIPVLQGLLGG